MLRLYGLVETCFGSVRVINHPCDPPNYATELTLVVSGAILVSPTMIHMVVPWCVGSRAAPRRPTPDPDAT